jgi:hypothetical protein
VRKFDASRRVQKGYHANRYRITKKEVAEFIALGQNTKLDLPRGEQQAAGNKREEISYA